LTKLGVNVAVHITLVLACSGNEKVTFGPVPASSAARSSIVAVHFVNPAA